LHGETTPTLKGRSNYDREKNIVACVARITHSRTAENWAGDVTEDVARAVLTKAQNEDRTIGKVAQEFFERTLGVDASANG